LPPPPQIRVVRLEEGETLGELCARELGSSARWEEIAELNGWSTSDVSALPSNCEVRLPIER
jgi:hypothetical protein